MSDTENASSSMVTDNPYVIIDKGAVERMEKGKTGISMLDIRNFFLWMFTMEVTVPKWIFVGNKPNIQNVTFLIEKKENTKNCDIFQKLNSQHYPIPVRKSPIPSLWDQYLLYGIQQYKREHSEISSSPDNSEDQIPFLSMCLTKEERLENNYIVVQDNNHRNTLKNAGILFIEEDEESMKKATITKENLLAIDCEMVETKGGVDELARVSIVSSKGVLLDEYVLPEGEIVDYRTAYSGITPAILKNCKNHFKDIQKKVYSILSQKHSIVVGHSLENDLLVLKIVHNYVIDTSVCYKHPTPGYKHALRYLCSRYLNRSIQNQNGGHNSIEDARAALDLVIFYSMSGISFKKSFEEVKPQPNKRSCLLQTISKANPRSRVVFMGWNDYIMNVSQTSSAGDMMVLKDSSTFLTKLKSISKSSNLPRFTYIYNIEYHFTQINNKTVNKEKSTKNEKKLDLEELCCIYKECYTNSLLCVLLIDDEESDGNNIGTFYVYLNTKSNN